MKDRRTITANKQKRQKYYIREGAFAYLQNVSGNYDQSKMNDLLNCIQNIYNEYETPILQGIITSIVIFVLLEIKKIIFDSSRITPINTNSLDIEYVNPTVQSLGVKSIGLNLTFDLTVQNTGKKRAKIQTIKLWIDPQDPFSHGLGKNIRPQNVIEPSQIFTYRFSEILNIDKEITGILDFGFDTLILSKKGRITSFKTSIFINPSHSKVNSVFIEDVITYNRFKSFLLRMCTKSKMALKVCKTLKIKERDINSILR